MDLCKHENTVADCVECGAPPRTARSTRADLVGQEKLLILCPSVTDDTLLHFSRRGSSYRLRAYAGRFTGRPAWVEEDAPTAEEFLRIHRPQVHADVTADAVAVERVDRWATIVTVHNRRLGIGGEPGSWSLR